MLIKITMCLSSLLIHNSWSKTCSHYPVIFVKFICSKIYTSSTSNHRLDNELRIKTTTEMMKKRFTTELDPNMRTFDVTIVNNIAYSWVVDCFS